jgi:hypothetical protein
VKQVQMLVGAHLELQHHHAARWAQGRQADSLGYAWFGPRTASLPSISS